MTDTDRRPLAHSPATARIVQRANNRFGAVVSSVYGFWTARDKAMRTHVQVPRVALVVMPTQLFCSSRLLSTLYCSTRTSVSLYQVAISNDMDHYRDPDQLLELILSPANGYGGTNFTRFGDHET